MSINCFYRGDIRYADGLETASCRLIESLVDPAGDAEAVRVPRPACEACEYRDTRSLLSGRPMFASMLYQSVEQKCDHESPADGRFQSLAEMAERTMAGEVLRPTLFASYSCDVVINCVGDAIATKTSLEAALHQDRAFTVVHLVGLIPDEIRDSVRGNGRVVFHSLRIVDDAKSIAVALLSEYRTEFVCFVDPREQQEPYQLGDCIERLVADGDATTGWPSEQLPKDGTPLLRVARRAALADLRVLDEQSEASTANSAVSNATLTQHLAGRRFRCDVMLPFHGQLDYVEQAIESVLNQRDVDVVVHLIDDCSHEPTEEFLARWSADSRVRTYRNETNIGQFMSFNNAVEFAETNFIAVQDGDDVSLPERLAWSIDTLELTDADIFAGAAEVFEETPSATETRQVRMSRYPAPGQLSYFCENPTLVMRRRAFLDLGGFADFGDPLANRCSVDTEFQTRAMLAGIRFALSQRTVLRYRSHAESSTNNSASGWGSPARKKAENLARIRHRTFLLGSFDPRAYGALKSYRGVTRRIG